MVLWLRLIVLESLLAAILFGSAGRLDLPWFWAVLGVHATLMAAGFRAIDPDLLRERLRPGAGGRDRNLRWLAMPFLVANLILAGLDVGRFGWSGPVPVAAHGAALVLYASGMALSIRAMVVNRFFSPVVRIQEERGHHLVTAGPYRYVRHPGYAGVLLSTACGGIALGSWWSLLPLVPVAGMLVRRTLLEDRYLRTHLDGYADYARSVRHRLVPGLW